MNLIRSDSVWPLSIALCKKRRYPFCRCSLFVAFTAAWCPRRAASKSSLLTYHISPSIVSIHRFQYTMVSKLSSNDEMFCCSLMPSTVPIYTSVQQPVFRLIFGPPPILSPSSKYSGRTSFHYKVWPSCQESRRGVAIFVIFCQRPVMEMRQGFMVIVCRQFHSSVIRIRVGLYSNTIFGAACCSVFLG